MRRRMKTHPRSRACSCPDTPGFRREIRSRDRVVPRRSIGRATRDRAHGAFRTRNTSISATFAKFAPREKKGKADPRRRKRFSRSRDRISNAGDSRDRRREGRARSMIDDSAVARSRDRSIARATGRPRARGLSEPAGGRAGDDDARGALRERERGKRARAGGFGAKKFARGDVEARARRRGRRRREGGGDSSIHRAIEPSSHPSRRGGRDGGHGRGVATSIDARAGGERDAR